MNVTDKKAATKMLDEAFPKQGTRKNPAHQEDGEDWRERLNVLLYKFAGEQTAVASLSEGEWTKRLEEAGFTADEVTDALDMIASWGTTDG